MKRPPPAFVVEVRRQRRSTPTGAKGWVTELAFADAVSGSERHPGAAALFEVERRPPPAAETAPSRPQGRILPSLTDIEPVAPPFEEPAASPRRKREGFAPAAKPKATPKTRAKRETSVEFAAPSSSPSRRSFEEPSVEWRANGGAKPEAERSAKSPSRSAKPRGRVAKAEPLAASALPKAEPAVVLEAAPDNAAPDRADARQTRHRRILERYVLGAELKPGERWKLRLQKGRK